MSSMYLTQGNWGALSKGTQENRIKSILDEKGYRSAYRCYTSHTAISTKELKELIGQKGLELLFESKIDYGPCGPVEEGFWQSSEINVLVTAHNSIGDAVIDVWAKTLEKAEAFVESLKIPTKPKNTNVEDPHVITVSLYSFIDTTAINCQSKIISVPLLEEIKNNYKPSIIEEVKSLLSLERPDELGKIILWTGKPGGGKTYLLRSLMQKWEKDFKASLEIILDPEVFLDSAAYMQNFLHQYSYGKESRLRIVVLEDSASFLTKSARASSGFSRLLNLTDGIIGQGQRIIYFFTANETLEEIDPAILRAGRCLQQLEVELFNEKEALNWLKEKNVEAPEQLKDTSLATLFEVTKNSKLKRSAKKEKIGF